MSQETELNLSEAAAEILKANLASKKGMPAEKLASKQTDITYKELDGVEVDGIKQATPPGATPPVGSEPMKKLEKQPAGIESENHLKAPKVPNFAEGTEEDEDEEVIEEIFDLLDDEQLEEAIRIIDKRRSKIDSSYGKKDGSFQGKMERLHLAAAAKERKNITKGSGVEGFNSKMTSRPKGYDTGSVRAVKTNEDIAALMAGENLSEDFKRKATAIFEAAVKTKVAELAEELEAKYVQQFEEAYEEMQEDFATKVDDYLDYVVESWMEENKLAVESGLKTEIVESFIGSLKSVFEEHYIDIPEEKFDVVEELASKVEALEKQVNEEMSKNIDLKQKLSEQRKIEALHSVCEGLTLSQSEKIKTIAESVDFVSEEDFISQMDSIKESYFPKESVKPASVESLNDSVELNEEVKTTATVDPKIAAYASIISKTLLK